MPQTSLAPALEGDEKETRSADNGGEDRSHWETTELYKSALYTSTVGFYLLVSELSRYLGVNECSLRNFLRGRSITGGALPLGQSRHSESYMRTLGIYTRMYGSQKTYLLLGMGPIALLNDLKREELEVFLTTPPPGIFWSRRKYSVNSQPKEVTASQAEVGHQSALLGSDVWSSLKCDGCDAAHLGEWQFMRLWTNDLDTPGFEDETVGLAFECECGRITIGAPLPEKSSGKSGESVERWSSADLAVQCAINRCPVVRGKAAALFSTKTVPLPSNEEAASSTGIPGGALRTTNEGRPRSSSGLASLPGARAGVTESNDGERKLRKKVKAEAEKGNAKREAEAETADAAKRAKGEEVLL